jgi:hypothetical protein
MLEPVTAPALAAPGSIMHGFFTRRGGVSQGIFASLNCGLGSKDDATAVRENRARVAQHLMAHSLVTAHQVHSAAALIVREAWHAAERPRVDALVTATPGIAVGVLAADCAPVLFADAKAKVVAAAHAGWRGALGGVLEAAVAAMETLGARRENVSAAIGPCIGQPAYEVGPEFELEFAQRDPDSGAFFVRPDPGARPHFDLPGYAMHRLIRAGLGNVTSATSCTFTQSDDFFSYRRSRLHKDDDYGRQISAIVLT